jgi:hypothetical protein
VTERLLHFIWQFQYYNSGQLTTDSGEAIQIIFPGNYNTNQGPDFSNAKIIIGDTTWVGTVELHLTTTDWMKHRHQHDQQYRNVILHVVWEHDAVINTVPVLELGNRVSKLLLKRYRELLKAARFIPCEKSITQVHPLTWQSWKERLLAERLLRKAALVQFALMQNNFHWEEVFWWLLARNFGMKVNADVFETIARSIPFTILFKQKYQLPQLEALLLGQAGLLEKDFKEAYPLMLQREYRFLQNKYQLKPVPTPLLFLRMRPVNFPTVRLAQLAALLYNQTHLFTRIKETGDLKEVRQWFDCTASDYWHYHYRFDECAAYRPKAVGESMIDSIVINTIAPILFAYGNFHRDPAYQDKALQWMEETLPEKNSIVKGFEKIKIKCGSGYDSQALLELKAQYCDRKRCLECAVGNHLLKESTISNRQ